MITRVEAGGTYRFNYTNFRGKLEGRRGQMIRVEFGANEYHPEPQFFFRMLCLDRGEERTFAVRDIDPLTFTEEVVPS